jgi:hypothetical protein
MPLFSGSDARRSQRETSKRRASLVVNLNYSQMRSPCLVLDFSKQGFRLRGSFRLRPGDEVELILDENPTSSERCSVVWVGKAGSKQAGEVGLKTV